MNTLARFCSPLWSRLSKFPFGHCCSQGDAKSLVTLAVNALSKPTTLPTFTHSASVLRTLERNPRLFLPPLIVRFRQPLPCATPSFETPLSTTMNKIHLLGPGKQRRKRKSPTDGQPFMKGVVLKTIIKKPKKPNSANRKCVRVRLSNGREAIAYVPGIGHNLQEHHIVLVRGGRLQDVPGVKLKCVRGKYDLAHVKKIVQ